MIESKKDDSDEGESDFGEDSEDSDDDYEENTFALKPWQQKKAKSKVSQLDQIQMGDSDDSVDQRADAPDAGVSQTEAPAAELEDLVKVTIPRRRLARWCNEPFFEDAVTDSFVRLFLGEDDNGEKVYRLCQIVKVSEGEKTYNFPTARREKPVCKFHFIWLFQLLTQKAAGIISSHFFSSACRFPRTSC